MYAGERFNSITHIVGSVLAIIASAVAIHAVIARGRDAADVAISNAFGPALLTHFEVWTYQMRDRAAVSPRMKGVIAASRSCGAIAFSMYTTGPAAIIV